MKKEEVLEFIDENIEISQEEKEDFESLKKLQTSIRTNRSLISESKAIAIDIFENVKDKLNDFEKLSVMAGINKLTLSFSHLGTVIKRNRDFSHQCIISDYLKQKAGVISASVLKDMLSEIVFVLTNEPELVQVDNYESDLKKKLVENEWVIGKEYEAKDKTLPESYFEESLPDVYRSFFIDYIKFRSQFMYPYAMVINSASDVKSVVDSAEFNKSIESDRYQDQNGNPLQSYDALNIFQKIDWLRRKLEIIMEDLEVIDENTDDYEIHLIFSIMELHDVRVYFGHLLPLLK